MKKCSSCKEFKELKDFSSNAQKKDGLNSKCRICYNEYMRGWYKKNTEKHKARVYASRNPALRRAERYGLTVEQVDAMIDQHNGLCHLCLRREATCIDHDHLTGLVRGMLCTGCNSGLGKLGDTIEGLQRAIAYLSR